MRAAITQFIEHFKSNPLSSIVAILLISMFGLISFVLFHIDVQMPRTMLEHNQAHHIELQKKLLLHELEAGLEDVRYVSKTVDYDFEPKPSLIKIRHQMKRLCDANKGYLQFSGWFVGSGEKATVSCGEHKESPSPFDGYDINHAGRNGLTVKIVHEEMTASSAKHVSADPDPDPAAHSDNHDDLAEPSAGSDQRLRIYWPVVDLAGRVVSVWSLDHSLAPLFRSSGIDHHFSVQMMLLQNFSMLQDVMKAGDAVNPLLQRAWSAMNGHGVYENQAGLFIFDTAVVKDPLDASPVEEFKLVSFVEPTALNVAYSLLYMHLGYVVFGYLALLCALFFYTRKMLDEKERMLLELKKKQSFLDSIFNSSLDAMITVNLQGDIIACNDRTNSMFDFPPGKLKGSVVDQLLPSAIQLSEINYRARYKELKEAEYPYVTEELVGVRGNGSEFPLEVSFCLLSIHGDPQLLLIVREIAERKVAEQELDSLRIQYFQQEKMAQIGLLVAGILHEVGNPLAAIRGLLEEIIYLDQAKDQPLLDDKYRKNLELVLEQTDRIRSISYEISGFASPNQSGRGLLDINAIISATTKLLRYDKRWKQIELEQNLDSQLPAIEGVSDQLTQVFMNLLVNASDSFASESDRPARVTVTTTKIDNSMLMLEISDNGSGISEEDIVQIFDPFYTTKPKGKGTGLGLSICEKLISEHNGNIEIDSRVGHGTLVRIYFQFEPTTFG
ncbi:MAG: ATP-binding protein [Motiliproteus sp.]